MAQHQIQHRGTGLCFRAGNRITRMGDVPINPTGFAHGFRPLDGDHPPPTPTQQSVVPAGFPNAGLFSQSQRSSQGGGGGGGMGGGLDWPRKRRRLPGPLAFFQQGGSGIAGGPGQDGGEPNDDNDERLSDRDQSKSEAGGGHFRKGPWLSLCSAIDTPIPDEGSSDARAAQTFLKGALSPMSEVLAGDFDLRVPVVTAVIDSYNKLSHSDVVVELVDPSGRMKGHLHPGCLEEHGPNLGPGAAMLLKEVFIFVSGPGTTRLLNVHPACVLAVFPADTPLPRPERLDWLRTCDPPFTPRPVPDGGGSNSGQPEEHLTSSPTTLTPKTPPVGGGGRRRARPVGRDEHHRSQHPAPPIPSPPRPQQSQPAGLCVTQGGSKGLGQNDSRAINSSVLGDSQDACRGKYNDNEDGDGEEEEEEDRLLQSAAFAGADGTAPSARHEDTDGAPSPPLSFLSPEGTQPFSNAQPPLRPAPDRSLASLFPESTPLAKSQSQPFHTPVGEGEGLEGEGRTASLRDTSRGEIRQPRADRTCGSTPEGCEGGEGRNPTTSRDNSREKARRPFYLDSPRGGSSGSAFLDRPAGRSEVRGNSQEASPPVSTLDGSVPEKRSRDAQQQGGATAESATTQATAPATRPAQAALDTDCAATARTLPGKEKGDSSNEPAGLGLEPIESVDGRKGVAGETRVSSSMWSDLDGLDSDDSDERDSSTGDVLQESGQPQDDEQLTDGGRGTAMGKHSGRSQDSDARHTNVGGRDTTAPSGVEGERGPLAGDVSLSNTAMPTGGDLTRRPQSNAAPDRHMTTSSGQADVSTGDALSQNMGATQVAALSGSSTVAGRGGVFSLLEGEGSFQNDDLLDAALDDSDEE